MTLNEFLAKAGELFKGSNDAELTKQLSAAQAELTAKSSRISELEASIAQRENQLKEANEKAANTELKAKEQDARIVKLEADHKAALEAKGKEVEGLASTKAQEILAKLGHSPVKAEPNKNPAGGKANSNNYTERCLAAKGKN